MLKAFTAWIKLNPELTGLPDAALAGHPLVLLSLAALQDADLFDDAVDATAELISATGLMMHHAQPPSRYMPLVQELVNTVRLCFDTGYLPHSASIARRMSCVQIIKVWCTLCQRRCKMEADGCYLLRCRYCSFALV